jgi:ATP-binding protein involved in chromosome partitioning
MDKRDVLQALSTVRLPDGRSLLESGHVQDVLIERHRSGDHVAVLVDQDWDGGAPPEPVLAAVSAALAPLPGVASARAVPRPRALAERAQAFRPSRRPPSGLPPTARVLGIVSAKGGVGKSTVTVNLAVAFARRGRRVALLDLDIYGFSVPDLMELRELPRPIAGKMSAPLAHGVHVMSLAFFVRGNAPVAWRGPMLGKAIRQFVTDTLWSDEELVLLDLPPGTGDVLMDVLADFPGAEFLVVTTPDRLAARVAERAATLAQRLDHGVLGVVENMAYAVCPHCGGEIRLLGEGGGDALTAALGCDVLARLPFFPPPASGHIHPRASPGGDLYDRLAETIEQRLAARPHAPPKEVPSR